jgi:hypothetical protein
MLLEKGGHCTPRTAADKGQITEKISHSLSTTATATRALARALPAAVLQSAAGPKS